MGLGRSNWDTEKREGPAGLAGPGGGWGAESQGGEDRLDRQLREGLEAEAWGGGPGEELARGGSRGSAVDK